MKIEQEHVAMRIGRTAQGRTLWRVYRVFKRGVKAVPWGDYAALRLQPILVIFLAWTIFMLLARWN